MMIEEKLSSAKLRRSAIRDQYAAGSILALVVLEEDGGSVSLKIRLGDDFFHRGDLGMQVFPVRSAGDLWSVSDAAMRLKALKKCKRPFFYDLFVENGLVYP